MKVRIFTCIAVLLLAGSVFFALAACAQRGTDGSGGVQHGHPDNEQAQSPAKIRITWRYLQCICI